MALNITATMVVWMSFRGMDWGLIGEMFWAMVAEAILIIDAYLLGILRNDPLGSSTALYLWQHGLMMPVMLVPMFLRLENYTAGMQHQARAA